MCQQIVNRKGQTTRASHGPATVCSADRTECHGAAYFTHTDYSGSNGAREVQRDTILAFWESQGVARWTGDIAHGGGSRWYVRDMVNGGDAWLPLARQGEDARADRAVFSHVMSAAHGGAWCACNLMPETGAVNHARGDRDMTDLPMGARALLAAWPTWWAENKARKASLARLSA